MFETEMPEVFVWGYSFMRQNRDAVMCTVISIFVPE